jgi:hypothetical protein
VLEMLVTLVVGAVVIGAVGALGFRQQRFHRDIVAAAERIEQLDQATALVPVVLRAIAPGEGDIPAGGARDTSLEFRSAIATAVVCDSGLGSLVLAPVTVEAPHLASVLTRPDAGDTVWSLTLTATGETWTPRPVITAIDSTTSCRPNGISPWEDSTPRRSIVLRVAPIQPVSTGTPIRVTRPWRYSIYKSSDGDWYLGAREWSATSLRFSTIQPVSGPFRSAAAKGLTFRYFDSTGKGITAGTSDTRGIALVQVTFRVDSLLPGRFAHAVGIPGQAINSVALRNRSR